MMARFRNFYNLKKSRLSLKRCSAFQKGAKIFLKEKNILRLGALKYSCSHFMSRGNEMTDDKFASKVLNSFN